MPDLSDLLRTASASASVATRARVLGDLAEATKYVSVVLANNPGKFEKVAGREDVQYALKRAAQNAVLHVGSDVVQAWTAGAVLGRKDMEEMLASLGVTLPSPTTPPKDLAKLEDSVRQVMVDVLDGMQSSLAKGDMAAFEKAQRRAASRAALATDAGLKQGATDGARWAAKKSGTKAQWKRRQWPNSCSHCRKLDGMVRPWGASFPHSFPGLPSLPVWGKVNVPPRHPWCACRLIPVKA